MSRTSMKLLVDKCVGNVQHFSLCHIIQIPGQWPYGGTVYINLFTAHVSKNINS